MCNVMRFYPAVLFGLFLVAQCLGKGGRGGGSRGGSSTSNRGSSASSSSLSRGSTFSGSRTSSSGFGTGGLSSSSGLSSSRGLSGTSNIRPFSGLSSTGGLSGLNNFRSNGGILSGTSQGTKPKFPGLPTSIAGMPFPATGIGLIGGSKLRGSGGSHKNRGGFDDSSDDDSSSDGSSSDSEESRDNLGFTDSDEDLLRNLGILTDSSENIYRELGVLVKSSEEDLRNVSNESVIESKKGVVLTDTDIDLFGELGIQSDSSENIYRELGLFSNSSDIDSDSDENLLSNKTSESMLGQYETGKLSQGSLEEVTWPSTASPPKKDYHETLRPDYASSAPTTSAQLAMMFTVAMAAMLLV